MKIVYNSIIPFKGYICMNLFGVFFVRKELKNKVNKQTINHESIHTEQIKELGYIFFYLFYFLEWMIKIPFSWFYKQPKNRNIRRVAYRSISFEQEAYYNENNTIYLDIRKHYTWIKYLFHMYDYKKYGK